VSAPAHVGRIVHPGSGIGFHRAQESCLQDASAKAWGGRATYTPADQILSLPLTRIIDGGMTTTARTMRITVTGDALADGDVKSPIRSEGPT